MKVASRSWAPALLALLVLVAPPSVRAQLDPEPRQLIQMGYNQPLEGRGPIAGYAFYYWNQPEFIRTNLTLRLAIAPVYLDGELGFKGALGPQTDLALGFSGGGFADSHFEIRQGKFIESESFTGHGAGVSLSAYHLFNPDSQIPLTGVLRGGVRYSMYERDDNTAQNFVLPEDRGTLNVRAGLRWGGREPLLSPRLAMELSAWYEGQYRLDDGSFGFDGDRVIRSHAHLFWGRALMIYTLPKSGQTFDFSMTSGLSLNSDRFSAYRLGSVLPLASEFALNLPGYYFQEITATRFVLFSGVYTLPLDPAQDWCLTAFASSAAVTYLPGFEQPGNWNSGVGGGLTYRSPAKVWEVQLGYAYGINAIRSDGRGSHSVGLLLQIDLEARRRLNRSRFDPGFDPTKSHGLERILGR